jgi:hypothetical protein
VTDDAAEVAVPPGRSSNAFPPGRRHRRPRGPGRVSTAQSSTARPRSVCRARCRGRRSSRPSATAARLLIERSDDQDSRRALRAARVAKRFGRAGAVGVSWIRTSAPRSSPFASRRIIGSVSARLRDRTSDTRPLDPIMDSRSRRLRFFCSIRIRIASIGSGASIVQCLASYASISVTRTSSRAPSGVPGNASIRPSTSARAAS